jgi:hypothetical protein
LGGASCASRSTSRTEKDRIKGKDRGKGKEQGKPNAGEAEGPQGEKRVTA